jgi:hypothetical protein
MNTARLGSGEHEIICGIVCRPMHDRVVMRTCCHDRKPQRSRRCRCSSCQSAESDLTKIVPSVRRRARCNNNCRNTTGCGSEKFAVLAAMILATSAAESSSSSFSSWTATTSAAVGQTKGIVLTEDFCNRNYMQISRLTLLCNTPGAYYHGSNAYRNSEVCMSGDKAVLDVSCMYTCRPGLVESNMFLGFCSYDSEGAQDGDCLR